MTLHTLLCRVTYMGDDVTENFAIPFIFFDSQELLVIKRDLKTGFEQSQKIHVDYEVKGGSGKIGTVIAFDPPKTGVSWTIIRKTSPKQPVDYVSNDLFPAETHEQALDRLTAMIQEIYETLDRCLTLPFSSVYKNVQLPEPGAGKYWRWNMTGTNLEAVDLANKGLIGLPLSINEGGTGANTADLAWRNLGQFASSEDISKGRDAVKVATPLSLVRQTRVLKNLSNKFFR
ncbi:MAG: hypothetical protein K1X44_07455 [Alphaproteobacteria bacterium]|nr:hypothetical protein [Alphaproteobacteria bacterium]